MQTRWVRIFFSLLISSVLWYSIKLVNVYTIQISVPVGYQNIPSNLKLLKPLPHTITARVSGKGHELLLPFLDISIDTSYFDLKYDFEKGYIQTNRFITSLSRNLPGSVRIEQIFPDTIRLVFEKKITKKVPVLLKSILVPIEGYLPIEEPEIEPDSIRVIGTPGELKAINSWYTVKKEIPTNVSETYIELETNKNVIIQPASIMLKVRSLKFVEGVVTKNVVIRNSSLSENIRLLPEQVTIRYLIPFDKFRVLRPDEFTVVLDVKMLDNRSDYVIPIVEQYPEIVHQVRVDPPFLHYVVTSQSE